MTIRNSILLFAVCLLASVVLIGCGKPPRRGPVVTSRVPPATAISNQTNRGEWDKLTFPPSARTIGIHQEGLVLWMAVQMTPADFDAFISQPILTMQNQSTSATVDTVGPNAFRQVADWWYPEADPFVKKVRANAENWAFDATVTQGNGVYYVYLCMLRP